MSNLLTADRLLKEEDLKQEEENCLKCIENFNFIIGLNEWASNDDILCPLLYPGVSYSEDTPGHTPITKEQKIEIVNRSLDEDTLQLMQNGDKIKYFDNNMGSLLTAMREVLGK